MKIEGQNELREYIKSRTLKQSEISKHTGVNVINLNKWINGNDVLGYHSLKKLENYFKVNIVE